MNPIQKSNLPIAITSIAGGACLAASITNLIADKPDYPIIAQAIIFTGWLVLWTPILFILFEKWVMPRLTGISRRDLVVHIALSFVISALIVFTTPISHQLYLPRKVLLEINATARKNPLATGAEIGILTASMDGSIIPWSEFSWGKNWDRIDDRPYFHDINPAQLVILPYQYYLEPAPYPIFWHGWFCCCYSACKCAPYYLPKKIVIFMDRHPILII